MMASRLVEIVTRGLEGRSSKTIQGRLASTDCAAPGRLP